MGEQDHVLHRVCLRPGYLDLLLPEHLDFDLSSFCTQHVRLSEYCDYIISDFGSRPEYYNNTCIDYRCL